MCGRYTFNFNAKTLGEAFGMVPPGFRVERSYNVAPGQWVIVVRPDKDQLVADVAQWGLVPSWSKDPSAGPKPINARAETVAEKPTFRGAFKRKRCLIPASGFYEWRTEGKHKQPFYIHPTDGDLFAFAGLLEDWQGPGGDLIISTCILTTTPNELMAMIHDRMPVILPKVTWAVWLDPLAQPRELQKVMVPLPSDLMDAYPVGVAVGDVRNNRPELLDPI